MDCVPLCIECKNYKNGDNCRFYETIPQLIKLREKKCPYYSGGEYNVYKEAAKTSEG